MKIVITEEQKKKLFIPRRQSGENSKWNDWNKEQPVKDGIRINQYTDDGLKTGIWEEYYSNGNIWSKGSYKDGELEGIWEYYWDDGNIESKGSYKGGKKEGIWGYYHNNGNLYLKELYKDGEMIKVLPLNEEMNSNGKQIKEGRVKESDRIKVYEDDRILVVVPLTHKASCKYGANTPWCVSVPSTDEHFIEYSNNGILFYFIIKSPYEYGDIKEYKFAYYHSLDKQMDEFGGWYDMSDYRYDNENKEGSSEKPDIKLIKFLIPKKVMEVVFNYIKEQTPIYQKKILDKGIELINVIINDSENIKIVDDKNWIIIYRNSVFGREYQNFGWFPDVQKESSLFVIYISKNDYKLYTQNIPYYIDIRTYKHSKKALDSFTIYEISNFENQPKMKLVFLKYFKKIALAFFANRKKYYDPGDNEHMYMYPDYVEIGDIYNVGAYRGLDAPKIFKKEAITGSYKPYKIDVRYSNGEINKDIYYNEDLGVALKYDKEKHNPTKI